ncbi:MAG: DegV family protein [Clostridia bacterium]|nr:DegV family protein [Clostridia bacterium]
MSKIKILCTSTGCIEYGPERYQKLGIGIIRIHMFFEGKEYLEGPELDPVKFYERLETIENPKNNLPKTGMPTALEITSHFDKAIEEGYDEIIIYCISSKLGGTYNELRLFAEQYKDKIKIHVVDTKITCFAEGYLAIRAAQMANEGKTSEEILKESAWTIRHQRFIGMDARLDYLIYNGRLKGGKAFMGQLLKICPLLNFNQEGECAALESIRTPKKALMRTCEYLLELIGDRKPEDYVLFHVYTGPKYIEMLKEMEEKYGIKTNHEDVIMSPVSGCHNGPWLAGYEIVFLRREDESLDD